MLFPERFWVIDAELAQVYAACDTASPTASVQARRAGAMRRMFGVFAAAMMLAGLIGQALASNGLYITSNDRENNLADLTATGSGNLLSVVQTYDGRGDGNALTVSLDGNLNEQQYRLSQG